MDFGKVHGFPCGFCGIYGFCRFSEKIDVSPLDPLSALNLNVSFTGSSFKPKSIDFKICAFLPKSADVHADFTDFVYSVVS